MEEFIPLIIVSVLLIIQIRMFKSLCKHLAHSYPDEWQALSANSLGTSLGSVTNANVSESLKTGYFSTIEDSRVAQYKRFRQWSLVVIGALLVVNFAMALWR